MKKIFFPAISLLIFLVTACSGTEKQVEKTAEAFYKQLNKQDYESALELIDTAAYSQAESVALKNYFKERNKYWGAIKSYKKYKSQLHESDSISVASVNYMVFSETDTVYELFEMIQYAKGQDFKIITYAFSPDADDVTPKMVKEE